MEQNTMSSSDRMQINTWTSSVGQIGVPNSHQTLYNMQFNPTPQKGYCSLQQKNFYQQPLRLYNPQYISQPVWSSVNLLSNQNPQMWSSECQTQLPNISPTFGGNPPTNNGHPPTKNAFLQPEQMRMFTIPHKQYPTDLKTSIQRNYMNMHGMNSVNCTTNANVAFGNGYCRYGSSQPWQHTLNRQHHETSHQPAAQPQQAALPAQISYATPSNTMNQRQMSVQYNETPGSVAHVPAASHIPVNSVQPSIFRTSSHQLRHNQVQNALHQPTSHLNSAIQSQSSQSLNQVSISLTQSKTQSQTTPIFGHDYKTLTPAIQSNKQPQVQQSSNTINGLTMNFQDTNCLGSSICQATSQTLGSKSTKNSCYKLLHLLLDKDWSTNEISSSNSFMSKFFKSNNGSQQSTTDNIASGNSNGGNLTQGKANQGKVYQKPVNETGISRRIEIRTSSYLTEAQKSSQNDTTNCKKKNEEVHSYTNTSDSLNLVISQLNKVQQVNKVVAVVPPISQQASSHRQQKEVTTSTHDSLPLKTDSVKNLYEHCENTEKVTDVPNMTCILIKDLTPVPYSPRSLPRLGSETDTSLDISKMPASENDPTPGSQSCDTSQCDNGPVFTTQISNKHQNDGQDLTLKCPVNQNNDREGESSSEDTMFDLSTIPVVNYTLQELQDLVISLEMTPSESDTSKITDVMKCIKELYYDGDKQNLVKYFSLKELLKISSELCVKETRGVVLQCLAPKHFKMLENCCQILRNESTLTSKEFRSSWLNVDDQPANVENVLAEPIASDSWCKQVSQSASESLVDSIAHIDTNNAEDLGVHAQKEIPKTTTDNIPEDISCLDPQDSAVITVKTECKTDSKILEKSRTPRKHAMMQRKSNKQLSDQLHEEIDMVKENKRAYTEPLLTRSSDKYEPTNNDVFEKNDTSDNSDFHNDLTELILLSSEDARKIFIECCVRDQMIEPHQLCQQERKDLTHPDLSKVMPFNDLKFICPHKTSLACGKDYFCPSCLDETPLFVIDKDETLLTPKEGEHNIQSLQSGKPIKFPNVPVCLESSGVINSIISTPIFDGSDVTRDPNPGGQRQSISPQPPREPHQGIAVTKRAAENLQKMVSLPGTQSEQLNNEDVDSSTGTKILSKMGHLSRHSSCNNVQTDPVCANNNLFSPDIVITNNSTHKQHPSDYMYMPRDWDKCSDEGKQSGDYHDQLSPETKVGCPSQIANISGTCKRKNDVAQTQKRPIQDKGHDGQSKETKMLRLELFGSSSSSSSCDEQKSPSTPLYLTVSPSPNTGKSNTDKQSAKHKVCTQWSANLIHPQRNYPYNKRHKHVEDLLKLKIQKLKIIMKNRSIAMQTEGHE